MKPIKITNSYIEGINKDLSLGNQQNKSLFNSFNIDLVTDDGQTTGVITNQKGNRKDFNIPNTFSITKILINILPGSVVSRNITVNSNTQSISISPTSSILDIYNQLISLYSTEITNKNFKIQYNSEYIYIIGTSSNVTTTFATSELTVTDNYISAQSNLSIIGWNQLDESIIIFTTAFTNNTATPNNTIGQIWKIDYDDELDQIISPTSPNIINVWDHLYYNDILNFSRYHEIYRETIGNPENDLKGNVYWTDNYNRPRVINIYSSNSFTISPTFLDWNPNYSLNAPIFQELLEGGVLPVGAFQISYQLVTKDGAISGYAPLSQTIITTDSSINASYNNYIGSEIGNNSNKSISIDLVNLDTKYDYIRLILVQYELENVPSIYEILEIPITSSNLNVVITGNEPKVSINIEDFVNSFVIFKTVKTFTQKKNRLYPANTSTENYNPNYDARAYRFNSSQECRLYSKDGSFNDYDATVGADITALHSLSDSEDAVNPYNDESGTVYGLFSSQTPSDWLTSYQYKYKQDGTTLGGEGLNISYNFHSEQIQGDIRDTTSIDVTNTTGAQIHNWRANGLSGNNTGYYDNNTSPFVRVNTVNSSISIPNSSTDRVYPVEGFNSLKSPTRASIKMTHSRGEVYRYGIVFFNNKGQKSFVKWIGDIRIPEPIEGSNFTVGAVSSSNLVMNVIAIEFEVTNIPSSAVGFQIVRVEREDKDKTKFGTGWQLPVLEFSAANEQLEINASATDIYGLGLYHPVSSSSFTSSGDEQSVGEARSFVRSEPFNLNPRISVIKGPIAEFDINIYPSYIKLIEEFSVKNCLYSDVSANYSLGECFSWWVKWDSYNAVTTHQRNEIEYRETVPIEGIVNSTVSISMTYDYHNVAVRISGNEIAGIGAKHDFVTVNSNILRGNNSAYTVQTDVSSDGHSVNPHRLIMYSRYNFAQYGGPWRVNRYNNIYTAGSVYIPINEYTSADPIKTFGDFYMVWYNCVLYNWHWIEDYGVPTRGGEGSGLGAIYGYSNDMKSVALMFPCESPINTEYRHGKYFDKNGFQTEFTPSISNGGNQLAEAQGLFSFDEFEYNKVYNQKNNLEVFISEPLDFDTDEKQRNWVWASERKIDRERIDNWRLYKINNYLNLENTYGPINKIVNFKEKLFTYQTRALANISSEELTSIQDTSGNVLQAGTGKVLSRFDYISKETGSFHQNSVVVASSGVYHYDIRLKKMFKLGEGLKPLTDIEGLSAYFRNITLGNLIDTDRLLLHEGVHGVYDSIYNKIYFTFLTDLNIRSEGLNLITLTYSTNDSSVTLSNIDDKYFNLLSEDNIIFMTSDGKYFIKSSNTLNSLTLIPLYNNGNCTIFRTDYSTSLDSINIKIGITLAFNEFIDSYESFYGFIPHLYLPTGKRLFSTSYKETGNTAIDNSVYVHNKNNFGNYYSMLQECNWKFITKIPDPTNTITGRLDYVDYWSEVINSDKTKQVNETLSYLLVNNDYQNCNIHQPIGTGAVRRERTWRINLFRDTNSSSSYRPFLRDKYVTFNGGYYNLNNRRFILHNWNTNMTISAH